MVGHVLQQAGHERIMQVVYSFHMHMLFILSGYFISNKKALGSLLFLELFVF